MANEDNVRSTSALFRRIIKELWGFAVDTFADGNTGVMTDEDVDDMMNRVLGRAEIE